MADLTILILAERRERHWYVSAQTIEKTLQNTLPLPGQNINIALIDLSEFVPMTLSEKRTCLICHPTPRSIMELKRFSGDNFYILVSGGDRPAGDLTEDIATSRLIWFSGIYGRETQFRPWLIEWARHGFINQTFLSSQKALFSGAVGIGLAADRLRENLLPIIVILEAYQAVALAPAHETSFTKDPSQHNEARKWVMLSISNLWQEQHLFRALASDAALIYNAFLRDWGRTIMKFPRLWMLILDFVPQGGGHADYAPPLLDTSMKELLTGTMNLEDVDAAVNMWQRNLTELSQILYTLSSVEILE